MNEEKEDIKQDMPLGSEQVESDNIDPMQQLQDHIAELEDQLKRSLADYQNLQKRIQQEREQMRLYGSESLIKALFPVLDNFYYAWKSSAEQESINHEEFNQSLGKICQSLVATLEQAGLKQIQPNKGEAFNAEIHEAVMQMDSEISAGNIAEILSPGYMLHEKVLKVAQVAVSKDKGEES